MEADIRLIDHCTCIVHQRKRSVVLWFTVIITLQCDVCMCMLFIQAAQLALASSIIFDKIEIQHNMSQLFKVELPYVYALMITIGIQSKVN